jgi:hypothetical protein
MSPEQMLEQLTAHSIMWCGNVRLNITLLSTLTLLVQMSLLAARRNALLEPLSILHFRVILAFLSWRLTILMVSVCCY